MDQQDELFCSGCGAARPVDAAFCPRCGRPYDSPSNGQRPTIALNRDPAHVSSTTGTSAVTLGVPKPTSRARSGPRYLLVGVALTVAAAIGIIFVVRLGSGGASWAEIRDHTGESYGTYTAAIVAWGKGDGVMGMQGVVAAERTWLSTLPTPACASASISAYRTWLDRVEDFVDTWLQLEATQLLTYADDARVKTQESIAAHEAFMATIAESNNRCGAP